MRVSREQAAASRERILDSAARLFRERGLDGIGVADLMRDAGLTHGGFYAHFASKEDLMGEACALALAKSSARWGRLVDRGPHRDALAAIVHSYLSTRHRDHPGTGCALATLGGEASRHERPVRKAITEGFSAMIDILARVIPGRTNAAKRQQALATYASLIGAQVLARAVDDRALSEEILQAVADSLAREHGLAPQPVTSAPA